MKDYQAHIYMICYPNHALVLSQLEPEDFAFRYNYGSASYYAGKLIFAEIDINYRNPYFDLDEALAQLRPHENGEPKATKYISSYRVLEHVEISAIESLYLANADGSTLKLEESNFVVPESESDLKVFAELTPLTMLTLSKLNMRDFGKFFTDPANRVSVPRLLYAQVELDIDKFLREFEMNPFANPPLNGVHPSKLKAAIQDLRERAHKSVKGLTLDTSFTRESYSRICHGFMFMDQENEKFFVMPSEEDIERANLRFYKGI